MKLFGKNKKSGDAKNASPAPASAPANSNPYAQAAPAPAASNPYAQAPNRPDPYAQDTNKYANMGSTGPSPYGQPRQGLPSGPGAPRNGLPSGPGGNRGKYDAPSPAPSAGSGGGYAAEKYGSGGGYGASRYEEPADAGRRPGGYGGLGEVAKPSMGRSNSADTTTTEDNRNALFGGAKDRYAQKAAVAPQRPGAGYGASSDTGVPGSYGAYGEERQLTQEEEEEEDVAATKQQIREMKREDVSSTRNALRIAAQAEESGRATLARLGAQGERIHNTEKNLDLAANHNRIAEERAKELKTLNRSMFAVHVSNPFTASSRRAERDAEIVDKHRMEREQREATRQNAFNSQQRMGEAFKNIDGAGRAPATKASLAERAKYQFEADSEDEEMENELDNNLDLLSGAAGRLNALARATGAEVDQQNIHIAKIIEKSDLVDNDIVRNRARLDRIK